MNYLHALWRMIFATIILIAINNTLHTMEKELTENQILLNAIKENLPEDVQTIIYKTTALLKMSKFLLAPTFILDYVPALQTTSKEKERHGPLDINENNEVWLSKWEDDGYHIRRSPYQLIATLAKYTKNDGRPISLYEDKIVMCSQNGSVKIWSSPEGELLHTLITNATPIWTILLIDHKIITVVNNAKTTRQVWPLYINFDSPEFYQNGEPFIWNKDNVTIAQADLIARIYAKTQTSEAFILNTNLEDVKIFLTFDENIRKYLKERLYITFLRKPKTQDTFTCVMQ